MATHAPIPSLVKEGMGLAEGVQRAFVGDLGPLGQCGSAMGTFNAAIGSAAPPAGITAVPCGSWSHPRLRSPQGAALAAVAAGQ